MRSESGGATTYPVPATQALPAQETGSPVVPVACVKGIAPASACGQTQAIANKREFATHLAQYIFDSAALQGYMD